MKKKTILTAKILLLATAFFSIFLMTGCIREQEAFYPEYGRAVWLCSSKNLIGFRGIYVDDDSRVTLVFNERYTMDGNDYNAGINKIFSEEVYPEKEYLSIGDTRPAQYYNEDLEIDGDRMTISFIAGDELNVDTINGFAIFTDEAFYRVLIKDVYGGREVFVEKDDGNDMTGTCYRQTYDEKRDVWSTPEVSKSHKHEQID